MKTIQSSFHGQSYDYDDFVVLKQAVMAWGAIAESKFDFCKGPIYVIRFRNGVEASASTPSACYETASKYAEATKRLTGEYP